MSKIFSYVQRWRFVGALLISLLANGCATQKATDGAPKPGHGILEYARVAKDASAGMSASLAALDKLAASTSRKPEKVLPAFSDSVHQLQIESQTVRAHAQAMETRGDAYFEHWEANLARMEDKRIRALAEQHRQTLQQHFKNVKTHSQAARAAFKPYLAGVRRLRVALEKEPASLSSPATAEQIQTLKKQGQEVEQQLGLISKELKTMAGLLNPSGYN